MKPVVEDLTSLAAGALAASAIEESTESLIAGVAGGLVAGAAVKTAFQVLDDLDMNPLSLFDF